MLCGARRRISAAILSAAARPSVCCCSSAFGCSTISPSRATPSSAAATLLTTGGPSLFRRCPSSHDRHAVYTGACLQQHADGTLHPAQEALTQPPAGGQEQVRDHERGLAPTS